MLLSFLPDHRILRGLVAFTLTLWLGGLGCAVGCEMPIPDLQRVSLVAPGVERPCPTGEGHRRRHKADVEDEWARGETSATLPPGELSLCPLVGQSGDLARKVRLLDAPRASAASEHLPAPGVEPYCDTIHVRLTIRDRGSTYLRCCVFLI